MNVDILTALAFGSALFVCVFTVFAAMQKAGEGQSPRGAIIEAWTNLIIGFSINFTANLIIIPLATHGAHLNHWDNWLMGWVFTAISVVRQYVLRRAFNTSAIRRLFG